MKLKQYRRKENEVTAIKLDGELKYIKWGSEQIGKKGDFLLNNDGEVYTVDSDSFVNTYSHLGGNRYTKTGDVWAKVSDTTGFICTKEGRSFYDIGDYIVSNDPAMYDAYAMKAEVFNNKYEIKE